MALLVLRSLKKYIIKGFLVWKFLLHYNPKYLWTIKGEEKEKGKKPPKA